MPKYGDIGALRDQFQEFLEQFRGKKIKHKEKIRKGTNKQRMKIWMKPICMMKTMTTMMMIGILGSITIMECMKLWTTQNYNLIMIKLPG